MFNLQSECVWAIYQPAMINLAQMMRTLPSAGPADDAARNGLPVQVIGSVAIIPVVGVMVKSSSWWNSYFGLTSTAAVTQAVRAARADAAIETIVLVFDTPGGSVLALSDLGDEIAAAAKEKTVIAQVDSMTASAGYYAASQASAIYAGRMDMIGSIGARMVVYDMSRAYSEAGIEPIIFDTGEFKSAGEPGTKITDAQKADFQRVVDTYFADFRAMVMAGRSLDEKQFSAISDGRMFFAQDALKLGLIDGVQNLSVTLEKINASRSTGRSTATARRRIAAINQSLPSL